MTSLRTAGLALVLWYGTAGAAGLDAEKRTMTFDALDMARIAAEDALKDVKHERYRFAIAHDVSIHPSAHGSWATNPDGSLTWTFRVDTPDAVHLNFGFEGVQLPAGATLTIEPAGSPGDKLVYDNDDVTNGQLWTAVIAGPSAQLQLSVPAGRADDAALRLIRVGHGYRGFGVTAKNYRSGACNMDVACLGTTDLWNEQRRSVGAFTINGQDICSGSLVNNTSNDRRMLFATATHCRVTNDTTAARVVVYWNYESATCRTPGSAASGTALPKPSTTQTGARFLAATADFRTMPASTFNSDFTLLEFTQPADPALNLYWGGWDRRDVASHTCAAPVDPAATDGLCASIHHPAVDEKRISFAERDLVQRDFAGGIASHYYTYWDPTPPLLPGIQPPPASVVPNVTEPGSSGSPLYNADRRLVGVLSGGDSACGATGEDLTDYYGRLASAWEGGGTTATEMKTHLDPVGSGTAQFIDGIGQCTAPAAPTGVTATAAAPNSNTVTWTAVPGSTKYRVLRANGACPGSGYAQIAEVDNATTYADTTVSGGSTYSYQVKSVDTAQSCPSLSSDCASATATGRCTLAPTFAGISSAAGAGAAQCGVNLAWNGANGNCGTGSAIRYNVFRSTTQGFVPSAANAIATCRTGTAYVDATAASGATYHYVVRAEDSGASGAGSCQAGMEDANTASLSAAATGPAIVDFSDDGEAGAANWNVTGSGGGANWTLVTTQAHSPTRSWYVPDPTSASERVLALASPRMVPDSSGVALEAWLRYNTETGYDGALLEYSLDGTTWTNITGAQGTVPANANRFLEGGYAGRMNAAGAFGAIAAWHGARTDWTRTAVDLADFRGRSNVAFRFRFKSDSSDTASGTPGFWVDDVRLTYSSPCASNDTIFKNGFETP